MTKKVIIGLLVVLFSVFGAAGYVISLPLGDIPVKTGSTTNLIPGAAFENNSIHTTLQDKREICNECDGTGWSKEILCPKCGGYGVLECTVCNGTGEDLNGNICPYCHGIGEIICPECEGTGGTKCKFCGGDGYYDPEKGDKKA